MSGLGENGASGGGGEGGRQRTEGSFKPGGRREGSGWVTLVPGLPLPWATMTL